MMFNPQRLERGGLLAVLLLIVAGCSTVPVQREVIGRSLEQREVEAVTLGQGPTVLVVAGIHGNEAAGVPLANRLIRICRRNPGLLKGHRLVVVPEMNPDGVEKNIRHNAAGVDLNRNWPASNRSEQVKGGEEPLSEPESRALHGLIERVNPVRVLTIHQPLECVDYDGPAAELAAAVSAETGLPVKQLGGRPGSMGTHLGVERGVPIVTLELPREADQLDDDALWQRYGGGLLAFLAHR